MATIDFYVKGDKTTDCVKNIMDYEHVEFEFNCGLSIKTQINNVRKFWKTYLFDDTRDLVAYITNSSDVLLELNNLISLNFLDKEERINILTELNMLDVYTEDMFEENSLYNTNLNIRCFEIDTGEEYVLDLERGFEIKSIDQVISASNNLSDAILWR